MSYDHCTLCPRRCGADRTAGQLGFCGMPAQARAARAALHFWEEPPISGAFGSGAVFFSGCTLRCRFCQNHEISAGGFGQPLDSGHLRAILEALIDQGAQNINLVTPTHFLPDILPALTPRLPVPVVWNCGGYESLETLRQLEGLVDVYLPDLKYSDPALAARLSAAPDYVTVAHAAIREMVRQTGPAVYEDGQLVRGTLVRHLVLPGFVDNSLGVLDWLAETVPPPAGVPVSILRQYVPAPGLEPPLDRRVTDEEYAAVVSWAQLCGLTDGFVQDADAAVGAYTPEWDLSGLAPESPAGTPGDAPGPPSGRAVAAGD